MRFVRIFLSLFAVSAGVVLAAPGPAAPLTLAQALDLAATRSPILTAQSFQSQAADGLTEQAGFRPNPTLDVSVENAFGTGRAQGVRSLEATVQASQTLERGDKRAKRVALAGRERDAATAEFAVRRTEVLAGVAVAYVETLAAQQRLALAAEPLQLARATLSAVDSRVRAGAASAAESARARAALAGAQAEVARAEAGLVVARATLAATWGGSYAEVPPLTGQVRVPEVLPSSDTFQAQLARHPRVELQQALIAGRRASLDWEQAQAVSDVTVGGGLRFLREGTDAGFVAGVSVPLPVRNQNQGNIRAARATLAGAEHARQAVELDLRAALTRAWLDLSAAHTASISLRRDALPATEEAHDIVRRAYEQGQLPLLDVLDAQRALVSLRRELLDAAAAYATALARAEGLVDSTFPATNQLLSRE